MSTRELIHKINKYVKPKMNIQTWLKNIGCLSIALLFAGHAWAQTAIRAITSGTQSGEIVVRVELSEPLAQIPEGFVIQNPARIALDLPGVISGMDKPVVDMGQGNLRSVAIAQANDRTRLVFNLANATAYTTELSGNTLLVRLANASSSAPSAVERTHFAPPAVGQATQPAAVAQSDVQNIDFRASQTGTGSVVVTLPSDQTAIDIRQQGGNVVVDLYQTTLPAALRRRLDVSDFRTPVQSVTAEQVGANVRLTITPTGNWDQSAFQAGNQFVLEVHPVKEDPNKLVQGTGYRGERLSLSFQNIDIRALLPVIADFTDFNIVTSDSVQGNLTLRLKDVPWDQALEIILQTKGLAVHKNGNVLWIAPRDEINAMRMQILQEAQEMQTLEPLRTQIFQLNYAKAEAVMAALDVTGGTTPTTGAATPGPTILSPRGSVIVDPRTNKLIVTDVPSKLENLASVLAQIDIPVRQVVIEARIVDAEEGWGKELGMRLSGVGSGNRKGRWTQNPDGSWGFERFPVWAAGGTRPNFEDTDDEDANYDRYNFFDLPAKALQGAHPGYFAFKLNAGQGRYLQLELQALETDNKARNIASPRLMTADSVTASLEQGVEIPYQEASSSGATSVTFKKAVLLLEVTPQITPDGNVSMLINISQDTVGEPTTYGPGINTKRINTQVTIENGGTVVIGGIFSQSEETVTRKIPLLGDIPLVGRFFRSTSNATGRKELLIFLTPRIVDDNMTRGVRGTL